MEIEREGGREREQGEKRETERVVRVVVKEEL